MYIFVPINRIIVVPTNPKAGGVVPSTPSRQPQGFEGNNAYVGTMGANGYNVLGDADNTGMINPFGH